MTWNNRTALMGPSPSDIDGDWDAPSNEDDRIHNRLTDLIEKLDAGTAFSADELAHALRSISPDVGVATLQRRLSHRDCWLVLDPSKNLWRMEKR